MLIYLLPDFIWEVLVIILSISFKEQWKMKSETQQKVSYNWILFNLYNISRAMFLYDIW